VKKQTEFQKQDAKQTAWESWFIFSIVFFGGIFFICTLEGSKEVAELPYFLAVSIINLVYCIYIGKKPR
jgi:hypothetical protein